MSTTHLLVSRTCSIHAYPQRNKYDCNEHIQLPQELNVLASHPHPQHLQKLEDTVNTLHQIGEKELGKPRQMIVQFTMWKYRDEIWKEYDSRRILQGRTGWPVLRCGLWSIKHVKQQIMFSYLWPGVTLGHRILNKAKCLLQLILRFLNSDLGIYEKWQNTTLGFCNQKNPTLCVSLWSSALELSHAVVCFSAVRYAIIFIFKCVIVLTTLCS